MANAVNVDTWNGGQTSRTIAFTPTAGRLVVVALTSSSAFGALGGGVAVSWNAIMTEQTGQNSEHEVAYWGIATGSTGPLTYGGVAVTEGAFCEYDITTASATDDSDQAASVLDNVRHAEALARHFLHHFRHGSARTNDRNSGAGMHQVLDALDFLS